MEKAPLSQYDPRTGQFDAISHLIDDWATVSFPFTRV